MENKKPETNKDIEQIDTRSEEERMKEIIKEFSSQTKKYPPMEWWEAAG